MQKHERTTNRVCTVRNRWSLKRPTIHKAPNIYIMKINKSVPFEIQTIVSYVHYLTCF